MNLSKRAQRVLHALAQGGAIHVERLPNGKVRTVWCLTREGHRLADCPRDLFDRLRRLGLIRSQGGAPYRITRRGLGRTDARLDQR